MNRHSKRLLLLPLVVVSLVLAAPAVATAAPPGNDDFSAAVVVDPSALPFSDSRTIDEATLQGGEPAGCISIGKSVWYRITPSTSGVLRADIGSSSFFERVVQVYRQNGSGLGGLSSVACASPFYNGQTAATFPVTAGNTYYVQAGGFNSFTTGTLSLSVQSIPSPANDDFAHAASVTTLPYHASVDLTGATAESGEPTPSCGSPIGSAWYAFTPTATGSYTLGSSMFFTTLAAYSGGSLAGLHEVGCRNGGSLTFQANAGATVYLQVTGGQMPGGQAGPVQLTLDVTPPPVASFFLNPGAPSMFDTVQFFDSSFDPVGVGIQSESWDFGDGASATSSGCCPTHRYGVDGSYHVTLTIVTRDGRTASAARDLQVATHDVAIQQVTVPTAIGLGKTKAITVSIANGRYAETVQVQLLKSVVGGGWQQVGVLTQYVPVKKGKRTVEFSFNYTAAPEDAVVGKITFQVVATIQGAPDAIPADNSYISLPVKVKS